MVRMETARHIGVLIYPHAQMSAVLGLTDLFAVGERLARARMGVDPVPEGSLLRVSHLHVSAEGEVKLEDGSSGARLDAIILPPSLGTPPEGNWTAGLNLWLRHRHGEGTVLASVCAGAFLLADTGLLDARPATTHWLYAGVFTSRFPKVRVDVEKLLIDEGDIITAGGLMAWTDLGLRLLERFISTEVMLETARFLLVDPPGREQRYYSAFTPPLDHGDTAIVKAQNWLRQLGLRSQGGAAGHLGAITLGQMAHEAGLELRTFQRRFRAATGMKPIEYCQHLRIERARTLLPGSHMSIDEVAWEVGYADPASFRRLFLKLAGLSPTAYRRRFSPGNGAQEGGDDGDDE